MISRYIYKVLLLYLIKLITEFAQPASQDRQNVLFLHIVSGSAYGYRWRCAAAILRMILPKVDTLNRDKYQQLSFKLGLLSFW